MNNNQIFVSMVNSAKESAKLIEKLFAVAQPSAVYGEPVISNNYTVITASEVSVGMGFGYGMGGGSDSESNQEEAQEPVDGGGWRANRRSTRSLGDFRRKRCHHLGG